MKILSFPQSESSGDGSKKAILASGGSTPPAIALNGDVIGQPDANIVQMLTGISAGLVGVDTDVSYTPEMREYDPPTGGRGICSGYHYRSINGTMTHEKCWVAGDEYGEIFWSINNFASSVKDTSIRTGGPIAYGRTPDLVYRWGPIKYVFLGGSINQYAWLTGCGRQNGSGSNAVPGFFYALDVPASYANNGTLLESAWQYVPWGSTLTNGFNKGAVHGSTLCWIGDSRYVARTNDLATFTVVADGGSSSYRFSGIATDSYGKWGALSKWGDLWQSLPVNGVEGTAFTLVTSVNISTDGGKTFTAAAKLPGGASELGGLQWSSLLCSYGLWLAIVLVPGTSGYSYAYSEDFQNWIIYSSAVLPKFYDAASDGVRWYATNVEPNTSGYAIPPIYQVLVDAINCKRRFNMEKGGAVSGPFFLFDEPGAAQLSTDENGKVFASYPSVASPYSYEFFPYSSGEIQGAIKSDGSLGSGQSTKGTRAFAFRAGATVSIASMVFCIRVGAQSSQMRLGIYDGNGNIISKTEQFHPFAVDNGGLGLLTVPLINHCQLEGGKIYYAAYWSSDDYGNVQWPNQQGKSVSTAFPLVQRSDPNEMPNSIISGLNVTPYRPYIALVGA